MHDMDPLIIYTTCPDADAATRIAHTLVEEGLAACTNQLAGMRSCYRWQGRICEDTEVVLLVKTSQAKRDAVFARMAALHPAQVPCLLALPVTAIGAGYAAWMAEQLDEDQPSADK